MRAESQSVTMSLNQGLGAASAPPLPTRASLTSSQTSPTSPSSQPPPVPARPSAQSSSVRPGYSPSYRSIAGAGYSGYPGYGGAMGQYLAAVSRHLVFSFLIFDSLCYILTLASRRLWRLRRLRRLRRVWRIWRIWSGSETESEQIHTDGGGELSPGLPVHPEHCTRLRLRLHDGKYSQLGLMELNLVTF